ncbi:MAG: 3-phosphoshikimate 1-carboxyvinyltransferase [Oscillospiraceae bacterium]|jgi:3-phosphoshikimate 1-carboxyvinyltransferase|nr:3-phosphoshikimate 1-carboxyvinyltransferase [Oscillospiraceae bacterium]
MDTGLIRPNPRRLVRVPSSKSLGHRAVICGALAGGQSVIRGLILSEDIEATLHGVTALGARWRPEGEALYIAGGAGPRGEVIDCGESGSTLRFLIPLAMLGGGETRFVGRGRLMARPLAAYEALFGDRLARTADGLRATGPLVGGVYALPGDVSSQFVSGLLLALPLCEGDSEIRLTTPLESGPYVALTLQTMRRFGVEAERGGDRFFVRGGQRYVPCDHALEADYSQAAFFLAAAALGRDIWLEGLDPDSAQGDRAILDILRDMGAAIVWENGLVTARAERLRGVTVDVRDIPDLVPPVAALCCFCEGVSRIISAGRLRLKESDRLSALAAALGGLGANIAETPDGLVIEGSPSLPGGTADARGDHRIAMAAAVAALGCGGPVALSGRDSVNKSYPLFWRDFEGDDL